MRVFSLKILIFKICFSGLTLVIMCSVMNSSVDSEYTHLWIFLFKQDIFYWHFTDILNQIKNFLSNSHVVSGLNHDQMLNLLNFFCILLPWLFGIFNLYLNFVTLLRCIFFYFEANFFSCKNLIWLWYTTYVCACVCGYTLYTLPDLIWHYFIQNLCIYIQNRNWHLTFTPIFYTSSRFCYIGLLKFNKLGSVFSCHIL